MRFIRLLVLIILLAACTPTGETQPEPLADTNAAALPDLGAAPELTNDVWLNTIEPLRLADLRGNVVLIEMWTFG